MSDQLGLEQSVRFRRILSPVVRAFSRAKRTATGWSTQRFGPNKKFRWEGLRTAPRLRGPRTGGPPAPAGLIKFGFGRTRNPEQEGGARRAARLEPQGFTSFLL
ncbi:hypothetical protein PCASD_00432 [Puccinia coronata f. sp. avenae]|uniref:Uncharacterized protein n=1 Tax=Puccinia coronata f. sp. avenae TaxID=200324 RepID=A0A2N5VN77_9BASI|nr:hypothetical protein PCASD_00432 [Puccinia coronata f. sp. avenae]